MKTEKEVREIFALIGTTMGHAPLRQFVWGEQPDDRLHAMTVLHALGWVLENEHSTMTTLINFVMLKSAQYFRSVEGDAHNV